MLVLSRKKYEKIILADGEIVLTVIGIKGDKVRIGIEAAKDITVHRQEVFEAIKQKEQQANE
jgi:carbon storage regulator